MTQTVDLNRRPSAWGTAAQAVWTVFLIPVLVQAAQQRSVAGWLAFVAVLVFVGLYLWIGHVVRGVWLITPWSGQPILTRRTVPALVAGTLIAILIARLLGGYSLALGVYLVVMATMALGTRWGLVTVILPVAGVVALASLAPGWSDYASVAGSMLVAGLTVWLFMISRQRTNDVMARHRTEAQLALVEQRDRVARDLHDVLGHSLTVITLKAEVAHRFLDTDPDRARAELDEVERLARRALNDIRGILEGSHQVSLDGELALARDTLREAGIAVSVRGDADAVPVTLQPLAAWAVREGVTNVLRHSGARRCTTEVLAGHVAVEDDGLGGALPAGGMHLGTGRGLAGLAQRAETCGAALAAQPVRPQGFRLAVTFPHAAEVTS